MIYPKHTISAGKAVREIHYGRKAIRNVYRKIGGVMKCVFSADLIYFIRSSQISTSYPLQIVRPMPTVVASGSIPQTEVPLQGTEGPYLHIYIPASYATKIRIFINGVMVNPTCIASRTYVYNQAGEMPRRTLYYCYAMLLFSTAENTITFAAEPVPDTVSNPLLQLKTTDKTSMIAAINELYTLINKPSVS